ncbi:hypothetical protein YC2023_092224 [Brassica napus]
MFTLGSSCKTASIRVSAGPLLNALQGNRTQDNLQRTLAEGFQLGVNQECSSCLASKGACGFNQNSGGSVCYCKDEPNNSICSSRKKGKISGLHVLKRPITVLEKKGKSTTVFVPLPSPYLALTNLLTLFLQLIRKRNKKAFISRPELKALIPLKQYSYAQDLEMRGSRPRTENGVSSEEEEMVRKMTLVGLWCIQSSPSDRPPMNKVVEMMEGSVDALEVPPRPVFQIPAEPLQESSTLSENISGYTEVCSMNVA